MMPEHEHGELISEQIHPAAGTVDASAMSAGEPGLPHKFMWRKKEYEVAEVLETWKTTGDCWSGSGERYVRRHWFRVRTTAGDEMVLYFERQARSSRERKARWWLFTIGPQTNLNK